MNDDDHVYGFTSGECSLRFCLGGRRYVSLGDLERAGDAPGWWKEEGEVRRRLKAWYADAGRTEGAP